MSLQQLLRIRARVATQMRKPANPLHAHNVFWTLWFGPRITSVPALTTDQVERSQHDADGVHFDFDELLAIGLHFQTEVKQLQQNGHQLFPRHKVPDTCQPASNTIRSLARDYPIASPTSSS